MGEITLIRHGQASFGTDDYDRLSPLGHAQSAWLGEYIRSHGWHFDQVVRGGLRRHRETAEGILQHLELPNPVEDRRFDEFHYDPLESQYLRETGSTAPQSRSDFLSSFPDVFCGWGEGRLGADQESYDAFETRVLTALDAATEANRSTLIVSSGGVIGVILRRTLGLSLRSTADLLLNIHNASVHRLLLEDGQLRLSLFNASPHLDPRDRAHARTYV
ncbi:MAG: histidine phosphatase family protein [Pseudomonadota bacterium]